jgi:deoxycytidine triphosphate deaminase
MFGNVLSNAEIVRLRESGQLQLSPFVPSRLRLAHYRLSAGRVLEPKQDQKGRVTLKEVHDFDSDGDFVFKPNEYRVFEVDEFLLLPEGVVGNFLPVSEFVERGLSLTAGKIDPGYGGVGGRRQKLHFGVKNELPTENLYESSIGLAYIYFVSLTGLQSIKPDFSGRDKQNFRRRDPERYKRANDDGVFYDEGDDDDDIGV